MNPKEIHRIEEVLGLPHTSNCPPGSEWFQNPQNVLKLRSIANVVSYLEAEFGIETKEERTKIVQFLTELHTAFGRRVRGGEKIDEIALPPNAVQDYVDEIGNHIPADAFVEGMRRQFKKG